MQIKEGQTYRKQGPILSVELTYVDVNNGGDMSVDEILVLEATLIGLALLQSTLKIFPRLIDHVKITFSKSTVIRYHFKLTIRPIYEKPGYEVLVLWDKKSGQLEYDIEPEEGRQKTGGTFYYNLKGAYCDKDSVINGIKALVAKTMVDRAKRMRITADSFDTQAEQIKPKSDISAES